MKKKITLKEFLFSDKLLGIHCKTEEQANILCEAFDKMGKKWKNGKSYLEQNNWKYHKENTVYYNCNMSGDLAGAKCTNQTIFEFENVYLGGE